MVNVCIAGSRTWNNYSELEHMMKTVMKNYDITNIISGCAKGGDQLGEKWAKDNNIPVTKFPAKWDIYGKSAGYRRNCEMAHYADILVIGIINNSVGSTHMYNIMKSMNKPIYIIRKEGDIS